MTITIDPIPYQDKPILRNLIEFYQYDFSELDRSDVGNFGLFGYPYLDNYWTETGRYPFFIRVDGKLAGFVLVHVAEGVNAIGEFFVLRKYRRQGVGGEVAHRIFDQFPGRWRVEQEECNKPAQTFWRKVIGAYTNGQFTERTPRPDVKWTGPAQEFVSRKKG
jgi:predicted acetyltransferase